MLETPGLLSCYFCVVVLCLAQGHNTLPLVGIEPVHTVQSLIIKKKCLNIRNVLTDLKGPKENYDLHLFLCKMK